MTSADTEALRALETLYSMAQDYARVAGSDSMLSDADEAKATLTRQQAEIEGLREKLTLQFDELLAEQAKAEAAESELATLRQRVEAAEDSRRLDWLIRNCAVVETDGSGNWRVRFDWMPEGDNFGPYADSPRAAIDAAIDAALEGGRE